MGSFDSGLKHTFFTGPWHYCGVCDEKTKIAKMRWQLGVLKCPKCFDNPMKLLDGRREAAIAAVLSDGKQELVPVDKLRHPSLFDEAEDFGL